MQMFPCEYGLTLCCAPFDENDPFICFTKKKRKEKLKATGPNYSEILTSSLVVWSLVVKYVWKPANPITDHIEKKQIKIMTILAGDILMISTNSLLVSLATVNGNGNRRKWKLFFKKINVSALAYIKLNVSMNRRIWKRLEMLERRWTCRRTYSYVSPRNCRPETKNRKI